MSLQKQVKQLEGVARWAPSVIEKLKRIEAIDVSLVGIVREQKELANTLLPKAEIADRLRGWFRSVRENYLRSESGPYDVEIRASDLLASLHRHAEPRFRHEGDMLKFLVFLLGDILEESVPAAVARLQYAEGPGSAERVTRLAELDAERGSLLSEREQLVDGVIAESGGKIEIHPHPETQQRLDTERERRERSAREEESRRRHEEALVAADAAAPRRAVRSPYLEGKEGPDLIPGPAAETQDQRDRRRTEGGR